MDIIKNISIIFISIFFESLPFLLLGALISSIIETYVSNEKIGEFIPKNKILGSFVGVFLGFFLPACDCAVIPVSKRLLKKKVPINVVISFMLASPIINPVVLLSTYNAFYRINPLVFWYRFLFGIIIALLIGIVMGIIFGKKEVIKNGLIDDECQYCDEHKEIDEDFEDLAFEFKDSDFEGDCHCHHENHESHSLKNDVLSICRHTAYDLFEVVKYLMFGALIASLVQVLLPRNILLIFNDNQVLSIVVLMLFAYLISLCSTSDSFVGKSLLSTFNESSIIAYLLLGPMIDIKNTMVLLGNYKKSFVWILITLIFIVIFLFSLLVVNIL